MNWWPYYDVTIQVVRRGRRVRKTVRIAGPTRVEAESQAIANEKEGKVLSSIYSRS